MYIYIYIYIFLCIYFICIICENGYIIIYPFKIHTTALLVLLTKSSGNEIL